MKRITFCTLAILFFFPVLNGYAQQNTWTNPLEKSYDTSWYANPKTMTYGGGEQQVYEINTPAGLGGLAAIVNSGDDSFEGKIIKLTKGVDLSAYYWDPIGTSENPFKGSFDGGNFTISGIKIDKKEKSVSVGLFGYVENSDANATTEFKNIILGSGTIFAGVNDNSPIVNIGSLIGNLLAKGSISITQCHNKGVLLTGCAGSTVGGLIGVATTYSNQSVFLSMTVCSNQATAKVAGTTTTGMRSNLGGLIGFFCGNLKIQYCMNNANLENISYRCFTGGFIGHSYHSSEIEISDSYSKSDIVSRSGSAGGIVGDHSGPGGPCIFSIERCYVTGSIKNDSGAESALTGGIVGKIDYMGVNTKIKDCLALQQSLTGNVVHRIAGNIDLANYKEKLENNYAYIKNKQSGWTQVGANDLDGASWTGLMAAGPINTWDTDVWIIYDSGSDANKYLPELQAFGPGTKEPNVITEFPYIVTFNSNGGSTVETIYVTKNGTIETAPEAPVKEGFVFDGWYGDSGLTQKWVFGNSSTGTKVTQNITLYAKWVQQGGDSWSDLGNRNTDWYTNNPVADVYELTKPEDLGGLTHLVNIEGITFDGKTIRLIKDVDISGFFWTSIGSGEKPFRGSFDGGGHTITGIRIDNESSTSSYSGFFGLIRPEGNSISEIKNITLRGGEIRGGIWKGSSTGAIAGSAIGNVTFTGCRNEGVKISGGGGSFIGGLVGYGYGNISFISCVNHSSIESRSENKYSYTTYVGGLIGCISGSLTVRICINYGEIKTLSNTCHTGGFVGEYWGDGEVGITDSYNAADITNNSGSVGGLIGHIEETSAKVDILRCFVYGSIKNVSGSNKAVSGGIIGVFYNINIDIKIKYCLIVLKTFTGETIHRIIGNVNSPSGTKFLEENYAYVESKQTGWTKVGHDDRDGANWSGLMTAGPVNVWDPNIWKIYGSGSNAHDYLPQLPGLGSNQPLIPNLIENPVVMYTVTFDSQGGTAVSSQTVAANSTLTAPIAPTRSGYTFDGWYSDNKLTQKWIFGSSGTKVTQDITLYAKWIKAGSGSSWTDEGNYDTDWYSKNKDAKEFTISTAPELAGLSQLVNNGTFDFVSKIIILKGNIDLSKYSWIPIGKEDKPFRGSFNGSGYTISNIDVSINISVDYKTNAYFGLFGYIVNDVENTEIRIENLILRNGQVLAPESKKGGQYDYFYCHIGALAGYAAAHKGTMRIENCHNESVSVKGKAYFGVHVGGLIGTGSFVMESCSSHATVTGMEYTEYINTKPTCFTGGLIGRGDGAIDILRSYNKGEVTGVYTTGGLVGGCTVLAMAGGIILSAPQLTILNSYNVSVVTSYNGPVGGLVGSWVTVQKPLKIINCYVAGKITKATSVGEGEQIAGGIVGTLLIKEYNSSIENCLVVMQELKSDVVHRIVGELSQGYVDKLLYNNYAYIESQKTGWTNVATYDLDGADWNGLMTAEPIKSWEKEIWKVYDFGGDANKYLPQLQGFGENQPLTLNPIGNSTSEYTVTFDSQGGSSVASQTVTANGTVSEPATPTRSGYIFKGWYSDPYFMNKWVFGSKGNVVNANVTLYALWIHDGYVLVDIPEVEGVEFDFGKYEVQIGITVIIEITILIEYNKSDVWLDVNGKRYNPVAREGQSRPTYFFEIPVQTKDLVIRIGGVGRNDGTGTEKADDNVKIYAAADHLHIQTPTSGELFVYSMSGQLQVRRHISEGATTIALPKGLYVVRFNDVVRKISVTN